MMCSVGSNTRLITTPHNGQKKTIKLDASVCVQKPGMQARWKTREIYESEIEGKFQLCEVALASKQNYTTVHTQNEHAIQVNALAKAVEYNFQEHYNAVFRT